VVQRIEQLHAELDVQFLIVNVVVLEQRKIEIVQARGDGDVTAAIPKQRRWLRRHEACRLDVVTCVAGFTGLLQPGRFKRSGKSKVLELFRPSYFLAQNVFGLADDARVK
jgi:hypothetical protein